MRVYAYQVLIDGILIQLVLVWKRIIASLLESRRATADDIHIVQQARYKQSVACSVLLLEQITDHKILRRRSNFTNLKFGRGDLLMIFPAAMRLVSVGWQVVAFVCLVCWPAVALSAVVYSTCSVSWFDQRACISARRKNRHGHWVCWISRGYAGDPETGYQYTAVTEILIVIDLLIPGALLYQVYE